MSLAEQLAQWSVGLTPADLDADVRHAVGRHLLDGVGVACAARRTGDADPSLTVAAGLGGPHEARVLGSAERIGAVAATLGTGALVHALDFDDTHAVGLVHATAVVLPAAFSVGQQVGASGEQVLLAAAVGYELACRIAAASPHGFHARGLHATAVIGPLAAAAVAARLTGLTVAQTVDALGIAGSSSAGLLEFLETGSSTKQLHPGSAGAAGVLAARLAAAGATGPTSVLEGRHGVYATLSDRPADLASVTAGLGSRWETTRITIKPYPACQLAHATLDALTALTALTELGVAADDVEVLTVQVPPDAVDVVCEPRAGKDRPRTAYEAKFSLPWLAAAFLTDGHVGVDTFAAASIARPAVAELARRVRIDVVATEGVAADAPGHVTAALRDGGTRTASVPCSSGGPVRPLTDTQLIAKFDQNAGDAPARDACGMLMDLTALPDLTALFDRLAAR